MRRVSPPLSRRAFTLVEILIVIAIIVLLAAILFPSFALVREKARQSTCASNLKQIGLAVAQYTQDYDEHYPTFYVDTEDHPRDAWYLCLPYVKNDEIFHCPSDFDADDCDPANGCTSSGKEISYGFNSGPLYAWAWPPMSPPENMPQGGIYSEGTAYFAYGDSLASDVAPSSSFLAADSFDIYGHLMDIERYQRNTMPTRNSAWRHGNWRNVLYGDGHVKMVPWHIGWSQEGWPIMLPRNRADYESYCLNPEKPIYNWNSPFDNRWQRCGDVPGQMESLATTWMPD
ncbi:hypothetical protein IAD21_00306 [Abditibacteriota bacterium]|nr:hypothetical protein IAD21_00306 [Abditibacteriota bacterium]